MKPNTPVPQPISIIFLGVANKFLAYFINSMYKL